MKLGWIPPLAIVVSVWYFGVMPYIPSPPIGYYSRVNSPIDLGILILLIMIMILIIVVVSKPMQDARLNG